MNNTKGFVIFICLCVLLKTLLNLTNQFEKSILLRYTISVCLCLGVGKAVISA